MVKRLIFILFAILFTACGLENTGTGGAVAVATNASFQSNNAVATLTAESRLQTQSANYSEQATVQIIQATTTQQAVEQGVYQSTINAQIAVATDTAMREQATDYAIGSIATHSSVNMAATGTAVAIELLATAQKQISDLEMENLSIQNQRELSQIKTREVLTYLVAFSAFLILLAFLARLAIVTWRNINPAVVDQQVFVFGPDRQWQTVNNRKALPVPLPQPPLLTSGQPAAPIAIELPNHLPKNKIGLGITSGNSGLWYSQSQLGDILGAGIKGSGKSTAARSIAFQAYSHGWILYTADAEQLTFEPSVWGNVASTVGEVEGMLNSIVVEFDRRILLFREAFQIARQPPNPQFVENLDDYNKVAARHGMEVLKPMLLIWDEANSIIGRSNTLDEKLHEILRRNRKPGCTVAIFAHSWHSHDVKSSIFRNMTRRIAFRCDERTSRVVLGNPSAASIPTQPGLAIMNENGQPKKLQSYYLPDQRILQTVNPIEGEWEEVETERKRELGEGDRERIIELYNNGTSQRKIEMEIFHYNGGRAWELVKEIIDSEMIRF